MLITNLTSQDYWFGPLHLPAGNGQTLTVDDTSATSLYLTDDSVADAINTLYAASPAKITVSGAASPFPRATGVPEVLHGDGSPEGIVYAGQGSLYLRRDNTGGAQLYQKTTGIHLNTGWVSMAGAVVTTPTGALHMYGGTAAPTGWLLCDGSAVNRTTYADLFAAIGTTFGSGDGSTTFNVPDMRGRVPVGWAASGGNPDVSTLGANDGQAAANRRPHHRTSITDPGHNHGGSTGNVNSSATNLNGDTNQGYSSKYMNTNAGNAPNGHTHSIPTGTTGITVGTDNANDALDAPSYIVVNYIVKT